MRKVTLPGTELAMSRLSFGTAGLHRQLTGAARQRILCAALDGGITHFDSSPYYGYGLAEHELGALRDGHRGAFTLATKVGLYPPDSNSPGTLAVWSRQALGRLLPRISAPLIDWSLSTAKRSLETSLRRLKTDCVDVLFLHEPDPGVVASEEFLRWLEAEKANGKLRYWGLAGHAGPMTGWLKEKHPLGAVLQVKDTLRKHEADVVLNNGRDLQITYGYLAGSASSDLAAGGETVLREALRRNRTGSVLFSTGSFDRIRAMSALLDAES